MSSNNTLLHSRLLAFYFILQALLSMYLLITYLFPVAYLLKVNTSIFWCSPFIFLASLFSLCHLNLAGNLRQLEYLNSQRHDFINHLQTIIGFIQLQKLPLAQSYAREVVQDLTKCKLKAQSTAEALQSLLIGISENAACRGVAITFCLSQHPLQEIPLPAPHLNRLVGNLLHNAIDAVEGMEANCSQVHFSLKFQGNEWYMEVSNPGPAIPAAILDKIFEPGFSTKAKTSRGQGLCIVKGITDAYGGRLKVESNAETGTKFTVVIPRV